MRDTQKTLGAKEREKKKIAKGTEYQGAEQHRPMWFHVALLHPELALFYLPDRENALLTNYQHYTTET